MYVRSLVSLALIPSLVAGCVLFKPIDPSGMSTPKEEAQQPKDTVQSQPVEAAPAPVAAAPAPTVTAPAPVTTTPAPVVQTPVPVDTTPVMTTPPAAPVTRIQTHAVAPAPRRTDIGAVNDATISAMVLASNYTDISYAQLVPARAQRADVREFARRMLTDHTTVNQLVRDLLSKLDLAPVDNIASLDMRDESSENRDAMRELSGFAFDSTYIENEVRYHTKFLASLDDIMIPRARNAELRTLLGNVRPAVAAHLAHAEQLRTTVLSRK